MDTIDNAEITEELMDLIPQLNKLFYHSIERTDSCLLPPTHMRVLITLIKCGTLNVTNIAGHMGIQRQQLTKILDTLSDKKLICRTENPENRRLILISITEEGKSYIKNMIRKKAEIFSEFLNTLTDEDKKTLMRSIHILKSHLVKERLLPML